MGLVYKSVLMVVPDSFTNVSKYGISLVEISVVNLMCGELLFTCVKKSCSLLLPCCHMIKTSSM